MEKHSMVASEESFEFLGAGWFDPIEVGIRERVRGFIEELVDAELGCADCECSEYEHAVDGDREVVSGHTRASR
jgi:hypothetical protein